jgi:hypothetical protein
MVLKQLSVTDAKNRATMRSGSNGSHALTLPRVWREAEMEGR